MLLYSRISGPTPSTHRLHARSCSGGCTASSQPGALWSVLLRKDCGGTAALPGLLVRWRWLIAPQEEHRAAERFPHKRVLLGWRWKVNTRQARPFLTLPFRACFHLQPVVFCCRVVVLTGDSLGPFLSLPCDPPSDFSRDLVPLWPGQGEDGAFSVHPSLHRLSLCSQSVPSQKLAQCFRCRCHLVCQKSPPARGARQAAVGWRSGQRPQTRAGIREPLGAQRPLCGPRPWPWAAAPWAAPAPAGNACLSVPRPRGASCRLS